MLFKLHFIWNVYVHARMCHRVFVDVRRQVLGLILSSHHMAPRDQVSRLSGKGFYPLRHLAAFTGVSGVHPLHN